MGQCESVRRERRHLGPLVIARRHGGMTDRSPDRTALYTERKKEEPDFCCLILSFRHALSSGTSRSSWNLPAVTLVPAGPIRLRRALALAHYTSSLWSSLSLSPFLLSLSSLFLSSFWNLLISSHSGPITPASRTLHYTSPSGGLPLSLPVLETSSLFTFSKFLAISHKASLTRCARPLASVASSLLMPPPWFVDVRDSTEEEELARYGESLMRKHV